MAGFKVLSESDEQVLRQLIDEHRSRQMRPINRPAPIVPLPTTPDVYIALTPIDGIPALVADKNVGTSTGSGTALRIGTKNTPGYADCQIYMVVFSKDKDSNGNPVPDLFPVGTMTQRVFNFGVTVGGDQWVLVKKDKFGVWFVETMCGSDSPSSISIPSAFAALSPSGFVVTWKEYSLPCFTVKRTFTEIVPDLCCNPETGTDIMGECPTISDDLCLEFSCEGCPCLDGLKLTMSGGSIINQSVSSSGCFSPVAGTVLYCSALLYGFGESCDPENPEGTCGLYLQLSFYGLSSINGCQVCNLQGIGGPTAPLFFGSLVCNEANPPGLDFTIPVTMSSSALNIGNESCEGIFPDRNCCDGSLGDGTTIEMSVRITYAPCSGGTGTGTHTTGTGTSGGGCSSNSYAAGKAVTSSAQTSLTMSVTSLLSGMLIVNVSSLAGVTGVTFGGSAMTKAATAGGDNLTQWYLQTSATTANVVATVAVPAMIAMNAVNLAFTTGSLDVGIGSDGESSLPTVEGTFNFNCEYLQAAFLTELGSPGSWGGGFTSGGQDVTYTDEGNSYTLTEGYLLNTTAGTLQQATLGSTSPIWYAVIGGYPI